jgi:phosphoribosylaminoimidazole-succinocarboxamide synthase
VLETQTPTREMKIRVVNVPELPFKKGKYDYETYKKKGGKNFLIPLEVIYRNTVPLGSSLRKRFKPKDFGLKTEKWPDETVALKTPFVEYTTKLEKTDRHLTLQEAQQISGLTEEEFKEIKKIALHVNKTITTQAKKTGFSHEDGKIELLYENGDIIVGDVAGTFDEDRFSFNGKQVSKEILRQYYKKNQPEWVHALEKAKTKGKEKKEQNWKKFCAVKPKPLPQTFKQKIAELYQAGTNQYTEKKIFSVPELSEAIKEAYAWLKEKS